MVVSQNPLGKFVGFMDYEKFAKIFAGVFAFGLLWGYMAFPFILKKAVASQSVLKKGAKTREELYLKIPFDIEFKVYFFNITNPDEVMQGAKPHVQEVGPYFFIERKFKYNVEDDDEKDAMEFDESNTFYWKPELNHLTGNEVITMVHPIVMGAILATKFDNEIMLPTVVKGIDLIFEPKTPFLTAKAWDIMYGGVPINCDQTEFEAQAICGVFETELAAQAEKINSTHYNFSMFKGMNGSSTGRFKVKRGIENIQDLNRMMEFNGDEELDTYDEDICNEIKGTDGLMFPPFAKKGEKIWAFSPAICRSLGIEYVKKSKYKGLRLRRYSTKFRDLKGTDYECFCKDPPDGCPPEGIMDLTLCTGAPLAATKPHFLEVDKSVASKVAGLEPDPKQHDIIIDFYLYAGNPLNARQRLQFNLRVEPVEEYPIMSQLADVYFPMFWVEEGIAITGPMLLQIQALYYARSFNSILRFFCIFIGLPATAFCGFMVMNQTSTTKINVVKPASQKSSANSVAPLTENMQASNNKLAAPPKVGVIIPNTVTENNEKNAKNVGGMNGWMND